MPEPGIIALNPALWTGNGSYPGIAISAAQSGAVGILDLEYLERSEQASEALDLLLQQSRNGGAGIRCGVEQVEVFQDLIERIKGATAQSKWLMLCAREEDYDRKSLTEVVSRLSGSGLQIACEAIDLDEAMLAEGCGVDAVIAKGHEGAGRVSAETSYVLLQRFRRNLKLPVWVRGGIGPNSAAAVLAAGGAGVVLDSQLLLCREAPLTAEQKEKLAGFDGTETELVGNGRESFRLWNRPGSEPARQIIAGANGAPEDVAPRELRRRLRELLLSAATAGATRGQLPAYFALGQDVAFALTLSRRFTSAAAVIAAIRSQAKSNLKLAVKQEMLAGKSPLAVSHGIEFPILQGAMTRVSDTADFALRVAEGGALPFVALALMRQEEMEPLLSQCVEKLSGRPWGVGLLGFVPPELRQEQLQLVLKYQPDCALIAGGRPDQAKELEQAGIKTYLHVPSPALLESFVEMGARRFIFEGKECGGHVGPRASFVLWESMIETLLQAIPAKSEPSDFHVVFAGGIHDSVSAAMVAAMAAPLVERGIRTGILMGTAYLFTEEAVASGAIVPKFQEAALHCDRTVLLETGPGHAIRCLNSPYKKIFDEKRKQLEQQGYGKNELRQELELMNLGRLRIASKGLARGDAGSASGSKLVEVEAERQWSEGMYMIGQVAVMHDRTTSIRELHESVCTQAVSHLRSIMPETTTTRTETPERKMNEPIAIVGMSCLFPKASDLESFWQNILNKVDCIEEIPRDRWDWSPLYSEDLLQRDKMYSKWGGFLRDIPFDPSVYGIPPSSLASIDPMQLLILEVTRAALQDAGYANRPFPKERTSIILANAGHGPITAFYSLRSMLDWTLSDVDPSYRKELEKRLPEWTEDSFPGYLGNVVAGRVANRFDLGGINFCIDAACASSLAALYSGINELRAGTSDMVLLAATDTHNQPGDYLSFSKTMALSPRGRCRTFDATADGIAISEGIAVLVLKRLTDAERDGDRIYALVRGIGGSSDGRDLSLTAPRPAGQMVALNRAYENAGISPASVELVEAHGTGTVAGDKAEVEALRNVFESKGADKQVCALGSVKTMIGHTKCTAGLASIIKVARSLYHRVLPPTMGVDTPNPACNFEQSPFYLNTESRPWLHDSSELGYPRRAGVSAFGFGGTNFHAVLEEYSAQPSSRQESAYRNYPAELFCLRGSSRAQLSRSLEALEANGKKLAELEKQVQGPVASTQASSLFDLAYRHHISQSALPPSSENGDKRIYLSIIAASSEDLLKKLEQAKTLLADETKRSFRDPRGIFFEERDQASQAKVAFLFPGQGSQQVNMLRDLSLAFGEVRSGFERIDKVLAGKFDKKLSQYVYPTSVFSREAAAQQSAELTNTHVAQPAVAAADMAAFDLLLSFGLKPDMCAGHSFGEYVALCAAGVMKEEDLFQIAEKRGSILRAANDKLSGSMTAVSASGQEVRRLIAHLSNVTLANLNSPRQCIISGECSALDQARKVFDQNKVKSKPIAVSAAFHSPLMEPALNELSLALVAVPMQKAKTPVYSNTLAAPYPEDPAEMTSLLCEHLVKPVEFQHEIEQMHEAGARIFVECGPGAVLSGLVDDILEGKEHLCLQLERSGKNGVVQLEHLLAQAFVAGLEPDLGKLYRHRVDSLLPRSEINEKAGKPKLTYLINGSHIKRYDSKGAVAASRPTEHALRVAAAVESAPAGKEKSPGAAGKGTSAPVAQAQTKNEASPKAAPRIAAAQPIQKQQGADAARAAAPQPALPPALNTQTRAAREQVMLEFQRSLSQITTSFLQTQERVMMAYLQQGSLPQTQSPGGAGMQVPIPQAMLSLQQGALQDLQPGYLQGSEIQMQARADLDSSSRPDGSLTSDVAGSSEQAEPVGESVLPDTAEFEKISATQAESGANLNNGLDGEALVAQLIQIVSDRTGYPPEMLDPGLDLEADLGIDSIKRVEILNNFRKLLPEEVQVQLESGIEKLAGSKTLQSIMDWIRTDLVSGAIGSAAAQTAAQETAPAEQTEAGRSYIGRALVHMNELPVLPSTRPELSGLYIITDPENGLAEALAAKLVAAGADTLILRHRDSRPPEKLDLPASRWELDLSREDLVRAFAAKVSDNYKNISGLIHLLPLQQKFQEMPAVGEASASFRMVRSLLILSRELLVPVCQNNGGESVTLVAASSMGGKFGLDDAAEFNPIQASIPGLLKTFAREYPRSNVRAIDFSTQLPLPACADLILAEIGNAQNNIVEVGYQPGLRLTPEALPQVLEANAGGKLELDRSSVVLVTGGARGITAELLLELAEKHKPNFIIVGRSSRPMPEEDPVYQGITGAREIKAVIMDNLRSAGKVINVPAVESIYQALLKDREIRSNLARLESAGARVHYYSLDVRDHKALSALIDRIYDSFGKIDAVIHGAGVIEDALLKDKTLASFDRVFGTKVESALTLSTRLQLDRLKYLIFFSSVVARTGNAGQSDYVAANEVLNKLALKLSRQTRARVLSILWGPWRGGMAQPELESVFNSYGWSMIEASDGRASFYNELCSGLRQDTEVLLVGQVQTGSGSGTAAGSGRKKTKDSGMTKKHVGELKKVQSAASPGAAGETQSSEDGNGNGDGGNGNRSADSIRARGARLNRAEILLQDSKQLRLRLRLDPAFDLYLQDHAFDGIPVLPMAVATELLAEAAQLLYPELKLSQIQNLDIPAGIIFESGARDLYISLSELSAAEKTVTVELSIATGAEGTRKNFTAKAVLQDSQESEDPFMETGFPAQYEQYPFIDPEAKPPEVSYAYENWLFHGPRFQGITSIDAIAQNGVEGKLHAIPMEECLEQTNGELWIIDPILLDSAMQLAGIWARHYMGVTALPTGFKTLHLFASSSESKKFKAQIRIPEESKNGQICCDLAIYDESGKLIVAMEGLGGVSNKSLNRLGAAPKALRAR